jgi:hypothetical protein
VLEKSLSQSKLRYLGRAIWYSMTDAVACLAPDRALRTSAQTLSVDGRCI